VPFELGRPFGAPNQPEFQSDVLRALLALFARLHGPVLEDYPYDAPQTDEMDAAWACALPLPPLEPAATAAEALKQSLQQEVGMLAPWYAESVRRRGRTTVNLSGLSPERAPEIAAFLANMAAGEDPAAPAGLADPMPQALRSMADDLKAYYTEAVNEQPGAPPSGVRMWRWLYHDTRLGEVLYNLRDRFAAELKARTEANGGQAPPGLPPPLLIPARFSKRPESRSHRAP
jgi:hypothetical protein